MPKYTSFILLFISSFCLVLNHVTAQKSALPNDVVAQIDQLFEEFTDHNGPGLSFGLMKDGELVYSRNIGKSNIKEGMDITSHTSFQLGELSRNFTAFAALLLEHKGQLKLKNPVIEYLPHLKIPSSIRVIDLLQHSSGLHNFHTIKFLAGWYHEAPYDQEDVLRIIQLQETPRFDPGTDFSYSETNLILLAEVIKAISGQSLNEFMDEQVFEPYGMRDTKYKSESKELKDVARGYIRQGEDYIWDDTHNNSYGVSNLFTSVQDLLTWEQIKMHPDPEIAQVIKRMHQVITLPSGRTFSIPQGQLMLGQYFTHLERGLRSDYLSSSFGPYTSAIFNFPDHDFIGVVLGNNSMPYNGYLVMLSAYAILEDYFTAPTIAVINTDHAPKLSTEDLEQYTGTFFDPEYALIRSITLSDDTLRYVRGNGIESPLVPIGPDRFQLRLGSDDIVIIEFVEDQSTLRMDYIIGEAEPIPLIRYDPTVISSAEMQEYVGTYFSKDLGVAYEVSVGDNGLRIDHLLIGPASLTPVTQDLFASSHWFMGSIFFERNSNDRIMGLAVRHSGAWDIKFEKMNDAGQKLN